MSEEELKAYRPQVEADKKRYDLEMKAWEAKRESKKAKKEAEDKERSESKSDDTSGDGDSDDDDDDDAGGSDEESLEGKRKKPATAEATAKSTSKKKKDPTKPKGGKSAYNFFLAEKKQEFEEAHPGKDWPSIVSLLSLLLLECSVPKQKLTIYALILFSEHCLLKHFIHWAKKSEQSTTPWQQRTKKSGTMRWWNGWQKRLLTRSRGPMKTKR